MAEFPDVVVLAGGFGLRLRSVVRQGPKVLAPVLGRPFLEHVLDFVAAAGASRVVLAVGYLADLIRETIGVRHGTLEVRYAVEREVLGTAGALANAAPTIRTHDALVLNGDSIVLADLAAVTRRHRDAGLDATMVTVLVEDSSRFGAVRQDASGLVTAFGEKTSSGRGYVNAGVYVLRRALMSQLPRSGSLERDVLPGLVERRRVLAFQCEAPFIDIGTPESYALLLAQPTKFLGRQ